MEKKENTKTWGVNGLVWQLLEKRTRLKPASIRAYTSGLKRYCEYADFKDPFKMAEDGKTAEGLDNLENLMEEFIRTHEDTKAPKHLNVIYNSLKCWLKATRAIKNRAQFREIDFDRSSRKSEALMEEMITTRQVKEAMQMSDIGDKVDFGLYALCGLRPTLISQLFAGHARMEKKGRIDIGRCGFHKRSAHIEDGKLIIDRKPALYIITKTDEEGKRREGNKANITFVIFIPSKLCELIETRVNNNGIVTPDTQISEARDNNAVYYKMKAIYAKVGFKGRPYLLRKFADKILDAITRETHDEDFKEFLMGHKGKISSIYQIAGLTEEDEKRYRDAYIQHCDSWINEHIFGTVTKEQKDAAKMIGLTATQLGVPQEKIDAIQKILESGKMTFEQFNTRIVQETQKAQDRKFEERFESMFEAHMQKRANNSGA